MTFWIESKYLKVFPSLGQDEIRWKETFACDGLCFSARVTELGLHDSVRCIVVLNEHSHFLETVNVNMSEQLTGAGEKQEDKNHPHTVSFSDMNICVRKWWDADGGEANRRFSLFLCINVMLLWPAVAGD